MGFGMLLGGALKGAGDVAVEEAKQLREARLQEIRDRQRMQFEHDESAIGREAQVAENERQRQFTAAENAKTRAQQGDVITGADGTTYVRQGTTATALKDEAGNTIKSLVKPGDQPAEVQTAEWLIKQGIAKNPTQAWALVRGARTDPDKSRASIYKGWLTALTQGSYGNVDAEKVQSEALKRTEETMAMLDAADNADVDTGDDTSSSTPGGKGPKGKTVKGPGESRITYDSAGNAKSGQIGATPKPEPKAKPAGNPDLAPGKSKDPYKAAKDAGIPDAPRDPAVRRAGTVYVMPDGARFRWVVRGNEKGWEPVK